MNINHTSKLLSGSRRAATAVLAGGLVALGAPSVAQAAPFPPADADLYDSFTTGDGTGTAGVSIAGTQLESGSTVWDEQAQGQNWKFSTVGGYAVVGAASGGGGLRAGLPDVTGQVVTVQALLDPVNTAYLAIALSSKNFGKDALTFRLEPAGGYRVEFRGIDGSSEDKVKLEEGAITRTGGFEKLALTYNLADNTVSASINDVSVLSNYDLSGFDTSRIDGTDDLINLGILRYASPTVANTNRADEFAVSTAPIPEPGTLSLLGLAGLMMFKRRRGEGPSV